MTLQDMDICLNITARPTSAKSKTKKKKDIKRLQNKLVKSKTDKLTKFARSENISSPIKSTVRMKQKSLAAIVAKKLAEKTEPKIFLNKQKSLPKNLTRNVEKPPIQSNFDSNSDSPIIKFVKNTKENTNKPKVLKKSSDSKNQKSLSDIFSTNSSKADSNFSFTSLETPEKSENKVDSDLEISTWKSKKQDNFQNRNTFGGKKEKQLEFEKKGNKFKEKGERRNKKFGGKNERVMKKPTGKISSLFGNNPEVLSMGQRFVKPVQEKVFSGIKFSDLDIHPYSVSNLEQNMQITKMTTVQQKAIPQILLGKDVLVRSQTGSGKTLAYALPIVESLQKVRPKLSRSSGLKILVVVPTRELALQTYECFLKLIKPFTWIVPGYLVGGEKRKAEKARLRRGCNILVATPGRLLDHIKHTEALKLNDVSCFVLDEADRMLDMGYEKDISGIVTALKISSSDPKETGYDAIGMLRKNVKKKITDESNPEEETEKSDSESEIENVSLKRKYHSSSDENSDGEDFPIKKKKAIEIGKKNREVKEEGENSKIFLSDSNQTRQTILLSATLTQAVEKLAGLTMNNPIFVDAAKENLEIFGDHTSDINEDLIVPQSVTQSYIVTPPKLRMVTLSAYIAGKCQSAGQHKILVFMATQDMIDYHTDILSNVLSKPEDEEDEDSDPLVDVEFFKLHGSMSQKERTDVFKTFRLAKSGVLLCTDVAARGLDMPKVDTVIQYTGPLSARDYVHRIGRTARAGSAGTATIFLTPPETEFVRMLESRRIRIKQEDMNDVLAKLLGPLSKHRSAEAAAIALQNEFENLVIEDKRLHEKACKAYISWMRFYASYPRDMREIFDRKELHLGHYAKSFALRDPPQRISGIGKIIREKEGAKAQHNNRLSNERPARAPPKKQDPGNRQRSGSLKKVRMLNTSEFDSGLAYMKIPRKG
ncbi:probable ATP-dependent RNA helicase CG8611 [Belonocnema kinseyi]|uniref:probable ATP-dependent RNA helicase CG8611 n=1 Tax=Belonocnema kinseyi TaxID=2817044 RepID=UPI00143CFAF9|nr:probable ATP-dependent RNA helicase CG8611 [Belonocnema kinseyi]XP_033228326.1 probable ATP-dependent RNA helicase CG8611 [Belonocnema kinseyi]